MNDSISRKEAIEEISNAVLKDRQNRHGPPENSFSLIADFWSLYLSRHEQGPLKSEDVAAMMMLLKVARICVNPQHADNWIDAGGYAVCGVELATLQQFIGGLANPVEAEPRMFDDVGNRAPSSLITSAEATAAYTLGKMLNQTGNKLYDTKDLAIILHAVTDPKNLTYEQFHRLMVISSTL